MIFLVVFEKLYGNFCYNFLWIFYFWINSDKTTALKFYVLWKSNSRDYSLTCPSPRTTNLLVVNSRNPMGPNACIFVVLIPISAPSPNCPLSLKRVDVLIMIAELSNDLTKFSMEFLFNHDSFDN